LLQLAQNYRFKNHTITKNTNKKCFMFGMFL